MARMVNIRKQYKQLMMGPHIYILRATLVRWTLCSRELEGIQNTKIYRGHSICTALTYSAEQLRASLNATTRNSSRIDSKSFVKFYHKWLEHPGEVQRTILRSVKE